MKKVYFYVVLTAFLFGTMEVALKMVGNHLDAFQLTFLRFSIGGILLLPFATAEMKFAPFSVFCTAAPRFIPH